MNEIKLICENREYLGFFLDNDFFEYGESQIEIKVSNYFVRGQVWFSFGELKQFTKEMEQLYKNMKGKVVLIDSECNLDITFSLNRRGYVLVKGRYQENHARENKLIFEMETTQPSFNEWISAFNNALAE
ncbi:hypothetical protein [Bacillus suaedae]|uniref:Uncharacterized protein n=1 Tax=Halalkalibacter suaedae TaxID=2822140 RepID=A0A940WSR5_9BACI|nr:hypothetical protein [Bacillus suaedae]MBP3951815.1 hypothetical protein [Bacillus suaedae]